MSSQYYKVTAYVGTPHRNAVEVTLPLVGPAGPQGAQGPKGDPGEVSGSIAWDNVTDKPASFTPSSHTHVAADITDFTAAVEAVSPPADWDTLANKPSTFTPSAHTHTLSDITDAGTAAASDTTDFATSAQGSLADSAVQPGDLATVATSGDYDDLSNKPTLGTAAASATTDFAAASHTHPASDITSGTLTHERGGLEADVSAYDGLLKISGGSTSAVTLSSAGEALLDDADAAAQRTTLGLGTAATVSADQDLGTTDAVTFDQIQTDQLLVTGDAFLQGGFEFDNGVGTSNITTLATAARPLSLPDASGTVALTSDIPDPSSATPQALGSASAGTSDDYSRADHVHGAPALNDLSNVSAAAPNDNDVLVYDNATSTWVAEAPAAGGVSAIGTSAADILSVSGSDIVADDLGADKLYGWDDSASKAIGYTIGSGLETDTTTLKTKITSDPSGVTGADAITNIMSLTQAEYNAIGSPNASTLYVITD